MLPKMHILEDHVPLFRRWHLGFGIMGPESIHAHLIKLERQHDRIANEVERYKYILREQLVESDPYLASLCPPPQKRPRKITSRLFIVHHSKSSLSLGSL